MISPDSDEKAEQPYGQSAQRNQLIQSICAHNLCSI